MITLAQRIQQLRAERGVSAPAISAALGLPRTAVEKFETGRQTPTQDQHKKLAAYFGVSEFYLRGESDDRTQMSDWMDGAFLDAPAPAPAPAPVRAVKKPTVNEDGALFGAFLSSQKFQDALRAAVLDVLRSPEGQALIEKAVRKAR